MLRSNDVSHVNAVTPGTPATSSGHISVPVVGACVRQPEVSQPSASPARPVARAHPVSSVGATSVTRRSGCPLASRQRWNGACSPHSGCVTLTCRHAPTHQSTARSSSPNSSAVRDVKQMRWRGRWPAAASARAIASSEATPVALSNAARNQPS